MRAVGRTSSQMAPALAIAFVLLISPLRADDAITPTPVASLALKDGRVLQNVRVIATEADSVVIKCDAGLIKIQRTNLPSGFVDTSVPSPTPKVDTGMVMMPFNPNPTNPEAPEMGKANPTPKPAEKPTPKPTPTPNVTYKGCVITSFALKPFQNVLGTAEVVFQNTTDAPVVIYPGDVRCAVASGPSLRGRQFVVDAFPPLIKRREVVPGQGSLDVMVVFSNDALDISQVNWAH